MPLKYSDIDWKGAEPFTAMGYQMCALPNGKIYVYEWVEEESSIAVQVHDDQGRDYIVNGNPTLGMLYDGAKELVEENEFAFLSRAAEEISRAARSALKVRA